MNAATHSAGKVRVTLPAAEQILIERHFEAPPPLVYRAFTTPELVGRWWHAKRGRVTLVEIDLRVGGAWRYVMVTHDGTEVGFHGEYREVVSDRRIVSTEVYEGLPEGVSEEDAATLNTTTFTEREGGTDLAILIQASSNASRDAILSSGMEDGLQDALDLLDQLAGGIADRDGTEAQHGE